MMRMGEGGERDEPSVELRAVDRGNWEALAGLHLPDEQQRQLWPNVWSIAEAQFESRCVARGIYIDDLPVGFCLYAVDDEEPDSGVVWVYRFMVAAEHQRKGYGTAALERLIEEIVATGATRIRISHRLDNAIAAAMYERRGFREIGMLDEDELERELVLGG